MKYLKHFIVWSVLLMVFLPNFVFAQIPDCDPTRGYCPLADLTGTGLTNPSGGIDFVSFIPAAIKFLIGIAGALAVIRIIIGGVQYMSTEAFGIKNDAKKTIQGAVFGLVLALSAYTILYTVNPKLVKLNFNLQPLTVGDAFSNNLGELGELKTQPDGTVVSHTVTNAGQPWGEAGGGDRQDRKNLEDRIVAVKTPTCTKIGQINCTSVFQIGTTVTEGLGRLKRECGIKCEVMITGGTESWLHGNPRGQNTDHRPGGNVVDLSQNDSDLNEYIRKNAKETTQAGCASGKKYKFNNLPGIYVDEARPTPTPTSWAPHWHVCF